MTIGTAALTPADTPLDTESLKRTGAAKDFEALLLTQMLHSVREDGSGWLSNGDDQSGDAAIGLGEEELAKSMAASGGLGLAKLINQGLKQKEGLLKDS
jgi:Rod binding domain-containing protein